jgi:hypothetical protein
VFIYLLDNTVSCAHVVYCLMSVSAYELFVTSEHFSLPSTVPLHMMELVLLLQFRSVFFKNLPVTV